MNNVVTTLAPLFFIGFSSLLQVTGTKIKTWITLNLKQNQPQTLELTGLECLEDPYILTIGDLL